MINTTIRIMTVLAIFVSTGNTTLCAQNNIKGNPFFQAKQAKVAAAKKAKQEQAAAAGRESERANKALNTLRQHMESNDLFDEKLDLEHDVEAMKAVVAKTQEFYWLASRISKDGTESWVSRLDDSNSAYLKSGKYKSEALPFLKETAIKTKKLQQQLSLTMERDKQMHAKILAARKRRSNAMTYTRDSVVTYDNYKWQTNEAKKEAFRQKAILDILLENDLDRIDEKLRAMGY